MKLKLSAHMTVIANATALVTHGEPRTLLLFQLKPTRPTMPTQQHITGTNRQTGDQQNLSDSCGVSRALLL